MARRVATGNKEAPSRRSDPPRSVSSPLHPDAGFHAFPSCRACRCRARPSRLCRGYLPPPGVGRVALAEAESLGSRRLMSWRTRGRARRSPSWPRGQALLLRKASQPRTRKSRTRERTSPTPGKEANTLTENPLSRRARERPAKDLARPPSSSAAAPGAPDNSPIPSTYCGLARRTQDGNVR